MGKSSSSFLCHLCNFSLKTIIDSCSFLDARVEGWPLMSSPLPAMAICLAYIFIVKVLGPKFMENRPAYDLRRVLLFYNLFQIVVNVWVFYELSRYGWLSGNYSFVCQPVDYSYDEAAVRVLRACYVFYLSKFVDLFDTFFFVLFVAGDPFRLRRPRLIFRISQFACACCHVFLLLLGGDGATSSKIPWMEEIPYHFSDGSIHCCVHSLFPIALY